MTVEEILMAIFISTALTISALIVFTYYLHERIFRDDDGDSDGDGSEMK